MSTNDGDRNQKDREAAESRPLGRDLGPSTGGMELAFGPVVFALIGLWIDRTFGTMPLFVVGLTILGFVGAVANVYYRYKTDIARVEQEASALRQAQNGAS